MADLTCDQLAQYRGCRAGNDCYDTCRLAAQRAMDNPIAAADPRELGSAARWAADQAWLDWEPANTVRGAEWPDDGGGPGRGSHCN